MNNRPFALFFLLLSAQLSFSQTSPMMETTRDALRTGAKIGANANQALYGIARPPGKLEGNNFLDTNFVQSNIMLYNEKKVFDNVSSRFDVVNNVLEIETTTGIRIVDGTQIKFFTLINPLQPNGAIFMNVRNFKDDAENLKGFFELITDGKTSLMIFHKAWEKKANYNEALSVGDVNSKIIKEQTFYLVRAEGAKKIGSSKKNLLEFMNDRRPEMEKLLKEGDYSLKSKADLVSILNYYNSLSGAK